MKMTKSHYTSEVLDLYYDRVGEMLALSNEVKNKITSMYVDDVSIEDAVDELDWLYNN